MTSPISLSYVIFILAAASTVPQLVQTYTTQQTRDFSNWSLALNLLANALLAIHGYRMRDTGLIALGAWFTIYWAYLYSVKLRSLD